MKRLIVSSIAIWLALPSIAFSATTITMDIDTAICMRDHGNGYITTRAVVVFSTICPPEDLNNIASTALNSGSNTTSDPRTRRYFITKEKYLCFIDNIAKKLDDYVNQEPKSQEITVELKCHP